MLINIGIEEILIITNKKDINLFKLLLGNGSNFGAKLNIKFKINLMALHQHIKYQKIF